MVSGGGACGGVTTTGTASAGLTNKAAWAAVKRASTASKLIKVPMKIQKNFDRRLVAKGPEEAATIKATSIIEVEKTPEKKPL